jgi:hypothetical protein
MRASMLSRKFMSRFLVEYRAISAKAASSRTAMQSIPAIDWYLEVLRFDGGVGGAIQRCSKFLRHSRRPRH